MPPAQRADDPTLPFTDPWAVLGVHRGASHDEVKAAFRRAALQVGAAASEQVLLPAGRLLCKALLCAARWPHARLLASCHPAGSVQVHPDVDDSPSAAARFTQVKQAADVLLQRVRRWGTAPSPPAAD